MKQQQPLNPYRAENIDARVVNSTVLDDLQIRLRKDLWHSSSSPMRRGDPGARRHPKPINPVLEIFGDEYATPYACTNIDFRADGEFVAKTCLMLAIAFPALNRLVFTPLARAVVPPPRDRSSTTRSQCHKFFTAGWKFVSYAFLLALGVWALWDQQHWLWNTETYASIFKDNLVPPRIRAYYLIEISYYLFSTVSIFFEHKMKDRNQMLLHHMVTLTLMFSSYYLNTLRFGVAVMILHDISDPLMEAAKLFNYSKCKRASNAFFLTFALTFVYTRVYLFPRHIIYAAWRFMALFDFPFINVTLFCFASLWCLHVFWSFLIFKVFKNAILEGDDKGDVREEDESDEDEAASMRKSGRLRRVAKRTETGRL